MLKNLAKIYFYTILLIETILKIIFKKSVLVYLSELIQIKSNQKVIINNKSVQFFVPNSLIKWRVDTLFSKEPETLEWIDKFDKKNKIIFWDIGANIGLYSIYNSLKNKKSKTIAFEPSTSNLRTLSKNISSNNLQRKIKIFNLPLSKNNKGFMSMKEKKFQEGGALNVFGESFDFEGKKFKPEITYDLFGFSIKYLLDKKLLEVPDYIKIDVDGIEHLILQGAGNYLKSKKIKSLSIEINENFQSQHTKILQIMKNNNFIVRQKKNNIRSFKKSNEKFSKTFNYIFDKK